MAFGSTGHHVQTVIVASATTESSAFCCRGWNHVALQIPALTTQLATATCNVYIAGCNSESGTFALIRDAGTYSGGAGIYNWEVPSSTGGWIAICPAATRFNWCKIVLSTEATDSLTCVVHFHN